MWVWIIISAVLIAADQAAKLLVVKNISPYDTVGVIDGVVEFINVKNTGAAFSILNNATWLLAIVSAIFCIGIIVYVLKRKPKSKLYLTGIFMMFAGAFGNGIDRIFRGYVIDFIKVMFIDFPVFNIADILIVLGALLCIVYIGFLNREEEYGKRTDCKSGNDSA